MANEAVLMTQTSIPVAYTCADGTAITKGSILKATDPNTAIITSGNFDCIAGVAYTDKIASNGINSIAVISGQGNEFKSIASGSIAVGDALCSAGGTAVFVNYLVSAQGVNASGSQIIGYSKEIATAGETFKWVMNIGSK